MIRVRKADGSVVEIKDGEFVELVNKADGTIGSVFFTSPNEAVVHVPPGSRDAKRYEQMFQEWDVKFTREMKTLVR